MTTTQPSATAAAALTSERRAKTLTPGRCRVQNERVASQKDSTLRRVWREQMAATIPPAARLAYEDFSRTISAHFGSRDSSCNAALEITPWADVERTVNRVDSTFTVTVSGLDRVPLQMPCMGNTYQIISERSTGWAVPTMGEVRRARGDAAAAKKIQATFCVCYHWTVATFVRAWLRWLWRATLRLLAWIVLLAALAYSAYSMAQVPWVSVASRAAAAAKWAANVRVSVAGTPVSPSMPAGGLAGGNVPRVGGEND
jgi:hypothetical protein